VEITPASSLHWVKGKVIRCHEGIRGSGGIAPPFLTSLLDGSERSASRPCRFITRGKPLAPNGWEVGWEPEQVQTVQNEKSWLLVSQRFFVHIVCNFFIGLKKMVKCNRPWRPIGLWDVSLTRRPPFTPRTITGTHFCYRLSLPQGHSAAGRIRSIEKSKTSSWIEPATFRLVA
jgi:hypothetical protein